ncbi:hypothetical protein RWE15_01970 [Virgibacillus halophilus]|uniref:Uncharacterized protein n=1 Tax=Tigheibacillus halophilus TaxID=361280 RepID=A0ABU5C277_9BACI|nr:hypothetical protein [Virgibacillus halophilus]
MEKLVAFHKKLYSENKTQVAITAIKATFDQLKSDGIPVYRLTPSYLSIKMTIQLLIERAQANHYENLQMAVIGFKVQNIAEIIDQYQLFKWKHHDLDLKKSLLALTESMSGSFVEVGDGLYFIFTTKGEIDNKFESALFQLIDEYQIRNHISITTAIGYGETVLHAEQNVRYGLNQSKIEKQAAILVVEGQHAVTAKFASHAKDSLNTEKLEQELFDRFGKGLISPRDAMRIVVYSHKYSQQEFTAEDISRWLQSTERNGRRILAELEQANVIEKCGKVQSNQRGRPKNIYHFVDNALFSSCEEKAWKRGVASTGKGSDPEND